MRKINLLGQRFGRLTVQKEIRKEGKRLIYWLCLCDCGGHTTVSTGDLRQGKSSSCGCLAKEILLKRSVSHGCSTNPIFSILDNAIRRCTNESNRHFKNYGGRGIYVCKEWTENPRSFIEWAEKNGYKKGLSIDRINNDDGYNPQNCRFISKKENQRNRRNTLYATVNGVKKSLAEWCEIYNLKYCTVFERIKRKGWDEEKAILTPVAKRERRQ